MYTWFMLCGVEWSDVTERWTTRSEWWDKVGDK